MPLQVLKHQYFMPKRILKRKCAAFASVVFIGLSLAACGADVIPRGNEPNPDMLSQLKPGTQNKSDVASMLGSPSTTSLFGQETWYYISAHNKRVAFMPMEETKRQVVAIDFDQNGVIKDIRNLGLEDGMDVQMVERETPTHGNELTIIQQLLGNVGRFGDMGGQ